MVQSNRFYWKRTPEDRDVTGVNCKILKPVKFAKKLDMFEFCSEDIQAALQVERARWTQRLEDDLKEAKKSKVEDDKEGDKEDKAEGMEVEGQTTSVDMQQVGMGLPADFGGNYELFAVVSHQGRGSDSGHYMVGWVWRTKSNILCTFTNPSNMQAWVKQEGKYDRKELMKGTAQNWVVFDDEAPAESSWNDIEALCGGGDNHIGVLFFYRAVGGSTVE